MKKILFLFAASALLCACGFNKESNDAAQEEDTVIDESDIVYICTGPMSECYHCEEDCRGLQSCSDDVIIVSIDKAEEMGRRPCKYCY